MSLQFIIDGYNISNHPLFTRENKNINHPAVLLPIFILKKKLTGSRKNKIIIVFDGYPPRELYSEEDNAILILFSRKISADEKIKRLVEEAANRRNIIVVSNDKDVVFSVKALGASAIQIEDFLGVDKKVSGKDRRSRDKEYPDQELSFTQKENINKELRNIWLK